MNTAKIRQIIKNKFLMMTLLFLVMLGLVFIIVMNIMSYAKNIDALKTAVPTPTVIYDTEGNVAAELSMSKTDGVHYEDIPKELMNAVIAVEDRRFLDHSGMDWLGVLRAASRNLVHGGTVEGGSTLTQQLAKNVFLTHERTYTRKWNEMLYAKKIERTYTKEQIVEMYLNQIYFGEGAWGVKRAAAVYFGKEPQELSLGESAMLAGMIKAPSTLSPYKNFTKATERKKLVLRLMLDQNYITEAEMNQALKHKIILEEMRVNTSKERLYPSYVDYIIQEAVDQYGFTENEVLYGGLHIYSEMNPKMQQAAESVYDNTSLFPPSQTDQLIQSGTVLVDPETGGIRALVGGRGDQVFRGFNHATQLKRQPGSTIKPLAVYVPAIEEGYRADSMLDDQPINIGGYQPQNYDGRFRGQVSMYDAIIHSYNVPAVSLLHQIGVDKGVQSVERFGISLEKEDHSLGLALGGLHEGTSPLKMAQAFSAFAHEGVMEEAHAIRRIEMPSEDKVLEHEVKATRVMSEETANQMTSMLLGVVEEGTGKEASIEGRMIAGKTGTTQLPGGNGEGAKDNWFVGYTPQLVAAVWLGYDQTDAEHFLTTTGKSAAIVFREIMREALSGFPNVPFDGIVIPQKVQRDEEEIRSDDNEDENEDKDKDKDKDNDENEDDDNEKKQDRKEKLHKEKEQKGKEHKNKHND